MYAEARNQDYHFMQGVAGYPCRQRIGTGPFDRIGGEAGGRCRQTKANKRRICRR